MRIAHSLTATALAAAIALGSSSSAAAPDAPSDPAVPIANQPAGPVFSLDQAIAYARAHQPTLAAARARLEAAARDADVPGAQWLPHFGALAEVVGGTVNNSTATILSNSAVDIARVGSSHYTGTSPDFGPEATTLVAVGVRQQIYDFGRTAAQSAAASALADLERARAGTARLELDYAVAQAYYAVLAAHSVLDASEQAQKRAQVHRDFAASAVKSGLRSPIEVTRAEADLARFSVAMVRARRGLVLARSTLAATMGAPDPQIDAADVAEAESPVPPVPDATARALSADPALRAAETQVRAEELRADAVRTLLRPNLYLSASFSARSGSGPASSATAPEVKYGGWVPYVPNYDVGLVLSVPIWDGTISRQATAADARATAARKQAEAVRLTIAQGVREAIERVYMGQESLVALGRAADAARANFDQADARFKVGIGTSTELADAEALRTEADIQLAIGRFQLRAARAALARRIAEGS